MIESTNVFPRAELRNFSLVAKLFFNNLGFYNFFEGPIHKKQTNLFSHTCIFQKPFTTHNFLMNMFSQCWNSTFSQIFILARPQKSISKAIKKKTKIRKLFLQKKKKSTKFSSYCTKNVLGYNGNTGDRNIITMRARTSNQSHDKHNKI